MAVEVIPDQTLNTLLVARELLRRGDVAADGTDAGSMAAVILFDAAVETGCKGILGVIAPDSPGDAHLPVILDGLLQAWRSITGNAKSDAPALGGARSLRRVRNTVQHDGAVPAATQVARSRGEASGCLTWATRTFLNREFSDLTRTDAIAADEVKAFVIAAESEARAERFREAMAELSKALGTARGLYERSPLTTAWSVTNSFQSALEVLADPSKRYIVHGQASRAAGKLFQDALDRIEKLERALDEQTFGLDASEHAWFLAHAPYTVRTLNGEWHSHWPEEVVELSRPDFDRAHGFLVQTVVRMEAWARLQT